MKMLPKLLLTIRSKRTPKIRINLSKTLSPKVKGVTIHKAKILLSPFLVMLFSSIILNSLPGFSRGLSQMDVANMAYERAENFKKLFADKTNQVSQRFNEYSYGEPFDADKFSKHVEVLVDRYNPSSKSFEGEAYALCDMYSRMMSGGSSQGTYFEECRSGVYRQYYAAIGVVDSFTEYDGYPAYGEFQFLNDYEALAGMSQKLKQQFSAMISDKNQYSKENYERFRGEIENLQTQFFKDTQNFCGELERAVNKSATISGVEGGVSYSYRSMASEMCNFKFIQLWYGTIMDGIKAN